MSGRTYFATGSIASFATAGDIVELIAPSDASLHLLGFSVTNSTSETDDSCRIVLSRVGTSGSGGSAVTARPRMVGDAAFGGTIEQANTTDSTGNTALANYGFSTLAGLDVIFTPESQPIVSPSGALVLTTVGDLTSLTLEYTLIFTAIGG